MADRFVLTFNMDSKLSNDEVLDLVNNYKKLEYLWNFRCPKYKHKDLRNKAWMHLAKKFNRDVPEIKKKIRFLRTAYLNEKKKVDESRQAAGEDLYKPKLFYYDNLDFLSSVIIARQDSGAHESQSSPHKELQDIEEELDIKEVHTPDYCTEYVSMPSPSPSLSSFTQDKQEKTIPSPYSYSSLKIESTNEPIPYHAQSSDRNNLYLAFGKTIAMQLCQLTPLEATSTMDVVHRLVSRDVMRSLLARTKPKNSSTSYEHSSYFKRKLQKNNHSEQHSGHRNFVIN